jgi:ribosomal protein S18 acetylase RimI-like enzyme/glutaredoxin
MKIRPYREADQKAVVALWRDVFPDAPAWNEPVADVERKLTVQRELFLVALEGDVVLGTAMAGYDGHRGWVYYVAVAPVSRRRGVGRALMERAETSLAALGCPKLNLQVRAGNRGAVAFYERLGYGVEERMSMGKRLTPTEAEQRAVMSSAASGGGDHVAERNIIVYSIAHCPMCAAVKEYLKGRGIEFTERDVEEDPEARAEFDEFGFRGTPLTVVDGEPVLGFDRAKLDALLQS